jgi:hypothetical protein
MGKLIEKKDIITQKDADIMIAKAMIKVHVKEIQKLKEKVKKDYGEEI